MPYGKVMPRWSKSPIQKSISAFIGRSPTPLCIERPPTRSAYALRASAGSTSPQGGGEGSARRIQNTSSFRRQFRGLDEEPRAFGHGLAGARDRIGQIKIGDGRGERQPNVNRSGRTDGVPNRGIGARLHRRLVARRKMRRIGNDGAADSVE